jgi:signal transduction histidine kinase
MMKLITLFIAFIFTITAATAQNKIVADSLVKQLTLSKSDTNRVLLLIELSGIYNRANPALSLKYAQEGLTLARKLNYKKGEAQCLHRIARALNIQGRDPEALALLLEAKKINEAIGNFIGLSDNLRILGIIYSGQDDYTNAMHYLFQANEVAKRLNKVPFQPSAAMMAIGDAYFRFNQLDSALVYLQQAYKIASVNKVDYLLDNILTVTGQAQTAKGNDAQAMENFFNSIPHSIPDSDHQNLNQTYLGIAKLFQKRGQKDSSIAYAKKALAEGQVISNVRGVLDASQFLASIYEGINQHEAFNYFKVAMSAKDSLFNAEKIKQVQNVGFVEQQRLQSIKAEKLEYKNKLRLYALLSAVGVFLLLAIILYRNNLNKQKANKVLHHKNEEIQNTLKELKATQLQLVQREKMASLGELTAGIAHEIQNPLNFVNNFSDVNKELIAEMKEEIDKGNTEEVKAIANDLEENEQKINHHGKRADAIVKGMLQHSRASTGKKELTDINALANEYLRLSYHGIRAKDKSFNANFKTDFDESIDKIEVVPQDVGRVLLNLYNNAFYAVSEKKKQLNESFEPTVEVTTRKQNGKVEISVKDNGGGIPQKVVDKIFQPFYTTKPTGQGTGLGLSLSYDIIKAHGGELTVESKEGEGAEFIIQLPISDNIKSSKSLNPINHGSDNL